MVGIGGAGMSAIAEILLDRGLEVSGSDAAPSATLERLRGAGARVHVGHAARQVGAADLLVVSSAVPADNPELEEAARRAIPVVGRGALLAELAASRRTVAVAGSHGKTTTTSMIALALEDAGGDPTAVIGGRVRALGGNARVGRGPLMVVEADESDRSFLHLAPEIAVLTSIDDEHLDAYGGMAELEGAFAAFAARVPAAGCVVFCADDARLGRLLRAASVPAPLLAYGIDEPTAAVRALEVSLGAAGSRCRVAVRCGPAPAEVELALRVPGRHNLQNALAALTVAARLGLPPARVAAALARFEGAERRFEPHGEAGGVRVVDDYGHHPTEVAAAIETARLGAPGRVIVVFQPHRYTRTLRLRERFGPALALADAVILTEVYAAGEPPVAGATSGAIAAAVRAVSAVPVRCVETLDAAAVAAAGTARRGDVVLTLGAGTVGTIAPRILRYLEERAS